MALFEAGMRIEKRNYSSKPWRLVTDDGREVSIPQEIDTGTGKPTVMSWPICGKTRCAVEAQALALLGRMVEKMQGAA
jgi:hypothetical protein